MRTIAFITHGGIRSHATLKRATGMAEPLAAAGLNPVLLLQEGPDNRHRVQQECPGASVEWYSGGSVLQERRAKAEILSRVAPDVLWICAPSIRNWVRGRGSLRPLMIADHSELLSGIPGRPRWRRIYDGIWERMFARGFDAHVCASYYLIRHYRNLTNGRAPLLYLPYAYSPFEALPTSAAQALVREQIGDRRLLLYAGTLSENYGIMDLIKAAAIVLPQYPDVVAVFAGRGRDEARARGLVESLALGSRIRLPGYVPDAELTALMASASAFVCPLRDTVQDRARCPSKLYLYVAHQKPVVTCRIGEAEAIFGDRGLYFAPGDIGSLADVLTRALGAKDPEAIDPTLHSWQTRTETFLDWLATLLPRQ